MLAHWQGAGQRFELLVGPVVFEFSRVNHMERALWAWRRGPVVAPPWPLLRPTHGLPAKLSNLYNCLEGYSWKRTGSS
jgi:hypothetical protein